MKSKRHYLYALFITACAVVAFNALAVVGSDEPFDVAQGSSRAESRDEPSDTAQDSSGSSTLQEAEATPPGQDAGTTVPPPQEQSQEKPVETQPADEPKQGAEAPQPSGTEENAQAEAEAETEEPSIDAGNVTMNFKGADIRTVLAYISEVSGVDIVAAPDVKGAIDLKLTNKPWKVALDIITRNYGFAYEREGDIIRVVTLDKLKQEEVTTQAFSLNYGKAKEIVSAVEDVVGTRGNVMYDSRTNMVLVTDIPTNVYKIGEIIRKLDRQTDQVLIEARVLETLLNDDERLGIDWNIKIAASGAKRPITAPFDYFDPDSKYLDKFFPLVQTGSVQTVTQSAGSTTETEPGKYPTGADGAGSKSKAFPYVDYAQDIFKDSFKFGTLDFSQFKMVLEMIKQRADTNVVSNPRIATLNNNPAYIIVGQTINMPKYERNSTSGKMEITGYESKDLGIKLKVTPHINEKGEIVVDLAPEISDFVRYDTLDASNGIVAPIFSSRQANTKVMIKDGDTIFIGGMIKENIVDVKKKVPFIGDLLSDVPYIGLLVSKKEKVKQKTELIFFLTVKLMKPGAELKDVPVASRMYKPDYALTEAQWNKTQRKQKNK